MEELGRSLTPAPMLGSAVLATRALLASGDEAACERLLPGLADGSQLAALAWTTAAGRWDPAEVACSAVVTGGAGGSTTAGRMSGEATTCWTATWPRAPRSRPDAGRATRPVRGRPARQR